MTEPQRPDLTSLHGLVQGLQESVARLAATQRESRQLTGEAWSPDRLIHAVVGPRGQLVELHLDPRLFRKPDAAGLAAQIVATATEAAADVGAKARELMERAVPADLRPRQVGGADPMGFVGEPDARLRARRPET